MHRKGFYFVIAAIVIVAFAGIANAEQPPKNGLLPENFDGNPYADMPFLGLQVQADEKTGACLVGTVHFGPLQGNDEKSVPIHRGDTLLEIDGQPATIENFVEQVKKHKPGDKITIKFKQTGDRTKQQLVPKATEDGPVITAEVVLDSRAQWTAPINYPKPEGRPTGKSHLADPLPLEKYVMEQVDKNGLREPINKLLEQFVIFGDNGNSFNMLSRIHAAFERPTSLEAIERLITDPLTKIPADPRIVLTEAALNLDADKPQLREKIDLSDPKAALESVGKAVDASSAQLELAYAQIGDSNALAKTVYEAFFVPPPDISEREFRLLRYRTLRLSMKLDYTKLLQATAELSGLMQKSNPPAKDAKPVALPPELKGAVEGDVLAVLNHNGRWLVYGAAGENTYEMSKIDVVIDVGGDNTYNYPARKETPGKPFVQVVVDMAGDDFHLSEKSFGPAAGIAGVSLLVDYDGDDRYENKGSGGSGVGIFGVGILLDMNGEDKHIARTWSQGSALYGFGALMSLGRGDDLYEAHRYAQGCGAPRGFGLIFDQGGFDIYRLSNGEAPSAYQITNLPNSSGLGFGTGFRGDDNGGIGVVLDLSGNDRYESGEFSMACGYFYGMGIISDRSGDDVYYGGPYTQGAAAHQAFAVLTDDKGNDTYWGRRDSHHGRGWDIAMGLLIDKDGNNSFYGGRSSQGAGGQQGIGWMINLGGRSHFNILEKLSNQGLSGPNFYHYKNTKCFSFSFFLNASGEDDFYGTTERPNGKTLKLGEFNEKEPEQSPLNGLFIDTPERLEIK